MHLPKHGPGLLPEARVMSCNAEDIRWLMEWAAFLIVIVMLAAACAWRWARAATKEPQR